MRGDKKNAGLDDNTRGQAGTRDVVHVWAKGFNKNGNRIFHPYTRKDFVFDSQIRERAKKEKEFSGVVGKNPRIY